MLTKIAISEYVPGVYARAYQPAYTACTPVSPPSYGGGGGSSPSYGGGGGSSSGPMLNCQMVCLPASTGTGIGSLVGGGYSICQTVCF